MTEWLNYHHLYYFWTIARTGSITEACEQLRLSQPTISAQLKSLEDSLQEKLFHREGRSLRLTEVGQTAFRYAEEIFSLGGEFLQVIKGKPSGRQSVLTIGVADVVPKFVAFRLLQPALRMKEKSRIVCHEDKAERLLAELSTQSVDLVISDSPLPTSVKVKAYSHFLGECGISFLATGALAAKHRKGFPHSLSEAPLLLPGLGTSVRRELDFWFEKEGISQDIVAEFADSSLMKVFGQSGAGVFPVPTLVENQVKNDFQVKVVGRTSQVKESFYLISVERKIKHPAVSAILEYARESLFGN